MAGIISKIILSMDWQQALQRNLLHLWT